MSENIPTLTKEGQEAVGQISGVTGSLLSALQPYLSSNPASSRSARLAQERYEEASVWAVKAVINHEKFNQEAANDLKESISDALKSNQESVNGDEAGDSAGA